MLIGNAKLTCHIREQNMICGVSVKTAIDWFFEMEGEGMILVGGCLPT
jgi:hypothetical protein